MHQNFGGHLDYDPALMEICTRFTLHKGCISWYLSTSYIAFVHKVHYFAYSKQKQKYEEKNTHQVSCFYCLFTTNCIDIIKLAWLLTYLSTITVSVHFEEPLGSWITLERSFYKTSVISFFVCYKLKSFDLFWKIHTEYLLCNILIFCYLY